MKQPRVGTRIGDYELIGELGRGGMGAVYRARERSGREVALKLVIGGQSGQRLQRFRREGELTAALRHPGIVRVHAAGEHEGRIYLAYELVEGARPCDEACQHLDLRGKVTLVRDAAVALGFAHSKGVVHRDVKPDNILVDAAGRVRVADFGLAVGADVERLTQTGAVVGTPSHMAPEQFGGPGQVGPPADVWALGVLLYELLTGEPPFEGASLPELFGDIRAATVAPPRSLVPDLPRDLEAICLQALRRSPSDRYPDATAFAADLEAFLRGEPVTARPRRLPRWLGRAVLVATPLVLLALPWLLSDSTPPPTRAPRIELLTPPASTVYSDRLVLTGRLAEAPSPCRLTAGSARARVRPGDEFALRVPLVPGVQQVHLDCADALGQRVRTTVSVRYVPLPGWYSQAPPDDRPPLPLPEGVSFQRTKGRYLNAADGSVLVWIPRGSFRLGSILGQDLQSDSDETPAHQVTFTRGFFLGMHEVTWRQYDAFCEATGRLRGDRFLRQGTSRMPGGDDHPVFGVVYEDAAAYCAWAGGRLPTAPEWEYAARGGAEQRIYPWGDEPPTPTRANLLGIDDGRPFTAPVGSYPLGASRWGALDMAGNMGEWTCSAYTQRYTPEARTDPRPAPPGEVLYEVRGGDWQSESRTARAAFRGRGQKTSAPSPRFGLRLCRPSGP